MASRTFKIRPASSAEKEGPYRANIGEAQLREFGGQNKTPAWIIKKNPDGTRSVQVQVLLYREPPATKGQKLHDQLGRVIFLSEAVRQQAKLSLSDEVTLLPDEDKIQTASKITLLCLSAAIEPSSRKVAANGGDVLADEHEKVKELLVGNKFVQCGQQLKNEWIVHRINDSACKGVYELTDQPQINIDFASDPAPDEMKVPRQDLLGVDNVLDSLDKILLAFREEDNEPWSISNPSLTSVLITGQSGSGKTLLLDLISRLSWPKAIRVHPFDSKAISNFETVLENASLFGRCLIMMDDLDRIKETNQPGHLPYKLVEAIRARKADRKCRILLVAVATSFDDIDPDLRKSDVFENIYRLSLPGIKARKELLALSLNDCIASTTAATDLFATIARQTPAFSGSDLFKLATKARREYNAGPAARGEDAVLRKWSDALAEALKEVHPTTMQGLQIEVPHTRFSDIGGQTSLKTFLKEQVQDTIVHDNASEDALRKQGWKPAKGLLMYGPPGCSKTLVAKAIATEFGLNFLLVNAGELINSYVGESEKRIREIFAKARDASPSVIFFDEFETLGGHRGGGHPGLNTVQTLLTELDGVRALEKVFVLAATNEPEKLDAALLRPGRISPHIMVGPPDAEGRQEIFRIQLSRLDQQLVGDIDLKACAVATDGCTGAEVVAYIDYVTLEWYRERRRAGESSLLTQHHFATAESVITKSARQQDLSRYQEWATRVRS